MNRLDNNNMHKKIILLLLVLPLLSYALYVFEQAKFTHGRKGIYNKFRIDVNSSNIKSILLDESNQRLKIDNKDFSFTVFNNKKDCLFIAKRCVVFQSIESNRSRKDKIIYYLDDGRIEYKVVSYIGIPSYSLWLQSFF